MRNLAEAEIYPCVGAKELMIATTELLVLEPRTILCPFARQHGVFPRSFTITHETGGTSELNHQGCIRLPTMHALPTITTITALHLPPQDRVPPSLPTAFGPLAATVSELAGISILHLASWGSEPEYRHQSIPVGWL